MLLNDIINNITEFNNYPLFKSYCIDTWGTLEIKYNQPTFIKYCNSILFKYKIGLKAVEDLYTYSNNTNLIENSGMISEQSITGQNTSTGEDVQNYLGYEVNGEYAKGVNTSSNTQKMTTNNKTYELKNEYKKIANATFVPQTWKSCGREISNLLFTFEAIVL